MSRVAHHGHGVYCYRCQDVFEGTDGCEHDLSYMAGVRKSRGEYVAQPDNMGHMSPCMFHEIEGVDTCVECNKVKIPDGMVGDSE